MPEVKVCLGGTFDPVHAGHIGTAKALADYLSVKVSLLPNLQPAHRQRPGATSEQRMAMLAMACDHEPQLEVDDHELQRQGPSYTLLSMQAMRQDLGDDGVLIWCMGVDAFAQLHTWYGWRELLDYGHILVLDRPDSETPYDAELLNFWQAHKVEEPKQLLLSPKGHIASLRLPQYAISATAIRAYARQGICPPQAMLPADIAQFVIAQNLYK